MSQAVLSRVMPSVRVDFGVSLASGKLSQLGKTKFVDVREFKGMVLVDIREYYEDKNSGELKPGKKGISLQAAQWEALKENMDKIDAKIEDLEK